MTSLNRYLPTILFFLTLAGWLWLSSWMSAQDDKWAKLEAMQPCVPHEGQNATVSVKDGRIECAVMGWRGGRRVLIDRRSTRI